MDPEPTRSPDIQVGEVRDARIPLKASGIIEQRVEELARGVRYADYSFVARDLPWYVTNVYSHSEGGIVARLAPPVTITRHSWILETTRLDGVEAAPREALELGS